MNYILFDDKTRIKLLPFTFTRPVADIRIGILTIREKWELVLKSKTSTLTESYLSVKYPHKSAEDNIFINGAVCPNETLVKEISSLKNAQALVDGDFVIALRIKGSVPHNLPEEIKSQIQVEGDYLRIENLWDIFSKNGNALMADFKALSAGRVSQTLSKTNNVLGSENVFVEEGASVEFATINAKTGPVYIGKNAEIMEGSMIRGPFALGDESTLKLGTKVYGPTTIGPHSKVGGEISNSVIFGFSNKAHDGFLGNSVIGEWCNLGADTNNSNLKNNYSDVQLWSYEKNDYINTGLTFCGLMMGDHSKCGINTMFNTGTVVGVSANIFGAGFPPKHIPSFVWGGASGFDTYKLDQAFNVAVKVFERRHVEFSDTEKNILSHIFGISVHDHS